MLADQLLRRFETLLSNHYLHRDIKPENFLLGMGPHGNVVFVAQKNSPSTACFLVSGIPLEVGCNISFFISSHSIF